MKILIVCEDLPSPSNATSLRVLNSVKYLSKKCGHKITLVAFKRTEESNYPYDFEKYCDAIEIIEIPKKVRSSFKNRLAYTTKNMLSPQNIFSKNPCFFNYFYSPKMQKRINNLLKTDNFDLIFVNFWMMLFNVLDTSIPRVIEIYATSKGYQEAYKCEKKIFLKIYRLFRYYLTISWENRYKKFDTCVTISYQDVDFLKSRLPTSDISVIPYGVDTEYYMPMPIEKEVFSSLIFVGSMNSQNNINTILYFYTKIFPLIREKNPDTKLYIVGKNPSKEIMQLSTDKSVIVTGFVEDVRPYYTLSSIVVTPFIRGVGTKTKVLEAMAMGKPIISTSIGAHGIDVTPEENIIIADEPKEFAERVIELLTDEKLRKKIGANARKLMEEEYSWEKMTDKLNDVFQKVVNKR